MGCASSTTATSFEVVQPECQEFFQNFTIEEQLGKGCFAEVYACKRLVLKPGDIAPKEPCAVKIVKCDRQTAVENERKIWQLVTGHPNVVLLRSTYEDASCSYFVMERCKHSLGDAFLVDDWLQETGILATFRTMLVALQHCHSMQVLHRDVKPPNFLVGLDGLVKLCDFGLAKMETEQGFTGYVGTPPFMSPEMVLGKRYNHKTDVWSLGATMYSLLYKRYPYEVRKIDRIVLPGKKRLSDSQLMRNAIGTAAIPPSHSTSQMCDLDPSPSEQQLVRSLLERDPALRPSAKESLLLIDTHQLNFAGGLEKDNESADGEFCRLCSTHSPTSTVSTAASPNPDIWSTRDHSLASLQSSLDI